MVHTMLTTTDIPKSFSAEAVNWNIHVLNKSSTFAIINMTPEEAGTRHRPTVDHFRIFDYIAYAYILDEKQKKLDNKGVKCIFLGVSKPSKAYKLYNSTTKKIIISRDVLFDKKNV